MFAFGRQISEKSEGSVTIALARIDDIFYMFIDGQAVMNFTAEDYNGKDLVVGIFQKNAVQNTQITAMTYLSGSEAETKFNTLTDKGSKLFDEYKPDNYWTGVNKSGEHIESSLESGKGANRAVLLSSHITSDLEKICDYIVYIHDGKIIFNEEKDVLLNKYAVYSIDEKKLGELDGDAFVRIIRREYGMEVLAEKDKMPHDFEYKPVTLDDIMLFYSKGEQICLPFCHIRKR